MPTIKFKLKNRKKCYYRKNKKLLNDKIISYDSCPCFDFHSDICNLLNIDFENIKDYKRPQACKDRFGK